MNALVVDDEELARTLMAHYCRLCAAITSHTTAASAAEARTVIASSPPVDVILLDIDLPDETGVHLLESLPHHPPVIFTTAYPDFAVDAFTLRATDYLLKPFSYERFCDAVSRVSAWERSAPGQDAVTVSLPGQDMGLATRTILYAKAYGNYVRVYTPSGVHTVSDTLKSFLRKLPASFVQIHKSYIISVDALVKLEDHAVMSDGTVLPVGITFRRHIASYLSTVRSR